MKTLELNQMEIIEAGDGGFWTAFACGLTILAGAAVLVGTGGTGAVVVAYAAGAACGGLLGEAAATGSFE